MRTLMAKQHSKPLTHNSFRKDTRAYPQPRSISRNKKGIEMKEQISKKPNTSSTQPTLVSTYHVQPPILQSNSKKPNTSSTQPTLVSTYHVQPPILHSNRQMIKQKYYLILQDAFPMIDRNSNTNQIDNICIWYKCLDTMPIKGKRHIVINKISYLISDWATDSFQQIYFVCIDGIPGYLTEQSVQTCRVGAITMTEADEIVKNEISSYDILYTLKTPIKWQIPPSITHLKLYLVDQNGIEVPAPLRAPISIELTIENGQ